MDIDRTGARSRQAPIRHRTALLFACTALVTLIPGYSIAQDATSSATALETLTVQAGSGAGVLNTDDDSRSIVATETTGAGKMPTDILTAPRLGLRHHFQGNPGARRRYRRAGRAVHGWRDHRFLRLGRPL